LTRIDNYRRVYETIVDDTTSYIKLINLQSKVICNRIYGKRAHLTVAFLMSIHIGRRPIWLTRSGRTDGAEILQVRQILQSDSPLVSMMKSRIPSTATTHFPLNKRGKEYAHRVAEFIKTKCNTNELLVWTSTLPRAVETAAEIPAPSYQFSALNMLDTGACNGMDLDDIKQKMPEEWKLWQKEPFYYRLPGGESYHDLIKRLEPLVVDLERQTHPVLVISHLSTLQVLYSYFLGKPPQECLELSIPLDSVIELIPAMYGWEVHITRI